MNYLDQIKEFYGISNGVYVSDVHITALTNTFGSMDIIHNCTYDDNTFYLTEYFPLYVNEISETDSNNKLEKIISYGLPFICKVWRNDIYYNNKWSFTADDTYAVVLPYGDSIKLVHIKIGDSLDEFIKSEYPNYYQKAEIMRLLKCT